MIDVLIITYNEALNLPHCLKSVRGWVNRIFVIDSGSTDGTPDIAREHGAEVVHHPWEGYARQKNWAIDTLQFESPWVLLLDADEAITSALRDEIQEVVSRPVDEVAENGFFINRLSYFMDRPIRHCGYFPSYNMRLLKAGAGRFEDREVHEHVIISDPVGYIAEPMLHDDRRGLEHYIAKHNRYSTLEARALFKEIHQPENVRDEANLAARSRRHRWLKRHVMAYVPFSGMWRFLYMYFIRGGILDGRAGFEFSRFISMYDYMVALKLRQLRREAKRAGDAAHLAPEPAAAARSGLARAEGSDTGKAEQPANKRSAP